MSAGAAVSTADHPNIPVEVRDPEHELVVSQLGDFTGPFFQEVGKRKRQNRDAKILITADHAQTGVGKSSLSDFLAYVLDTSKRGFSPEKVAIDPPEFFALYKVLDAGSALVLEEGEQLDKRRTQQHMNVDARMTWMKERVRNLMAIINLPGPDFIDSDMIRLCDFWINVEIRGRARIYKKKIHRTKRKTYFETMQILKWPNMDGSETFEKMKSMKQDHIDDKEADDNWIRRSEHEKIVSDSVNEALTDQRNELLTSIWEELIQPEPELRGQDLADCSAVDISASRISQIANDHGV